VTPPAGRRIILGVCGGIAAYKVVEVCRRLVDEGATVVPVMTADAHHFVGEATFSALASQKVKTSLWSDADKMLTSSSSPRPLRTSSLDMRREWQTTS
jgi:phosphopantothenoylcysteine synthetase/decarboxylase